MTEYLVKSIGSKRWVWIKRTNNYLQMNDKLFVILEKIHQNISQKNIADWCCKEYGITPKQALEIINELHFLSTMQLGKIPTQTLKKGKNNSSLITFYSQKTYSFQNHSFLFSYGTDEIEKLFHPQLAHLTG